METDHTPRSSQVKYTRVGLGLLSFRGTTPTLETNTEKVVTIIIIMSLQREVIRDKTPTVSQAPTISQEVNKWRLKGTRVAPNRRYSNTFMLCISLCSKHSHNHRLIYNIYIDLYLKIYGHNLQRKKKEILGEQDRTLIHCWQLPLMKRSTSIRLFLIRLSLRDYKLGL